MEEKLAKLGEKAHQVVAICPKDTRAVQGRHAEITAMWNKLKVCVCQSVKVSKLPELYSYSITMT